MQTPAGPALGTIQRPIGALAPKRSPATEDARVIRKATKEDVIARLKHDQREREAHRICLLKIKERGLQMKLTRVEQLFDGSRLIFYYTAEGRVDFRELVRLLKPIHAKVNLIPFNPWPGAPYECSSNNRMHRFAEIVNDGGLSAPIRTPRGRDILAACGQLKSASLRGRRVKVSL